MPKISAVIIARNEERMIGDCLKSVSFCDEIILVDNGSKDKTKELVQELGAKVFEISTNDFSELRSLGAQKATGDWILYLDADERIDEKLKSEIQQLISAGDAKAAYFLQRKNFYLGKHQWPMIEKLERLFKKENLKGWKGKLHESPVVEGEKGFVRNGYILHYTHRDLESMVSKTNEWSNAEALLRFNSNHPKMSWWRFPRVMLTAFLGSYIKQGGFRAGTTGIVESMYQAFSMFITYAKLWEMQNRREK